MCEFVLQSHSIRCTESFMRENVVEELRHLQPDDQTKRKMLEILKRFHSEDETEPLDEDVDGIFLDLKYLYIYIYLYICFVCLPNISLVELLFQ